MKKISRYSIPCGVLLVVAWCGPLAAQNEAPAAGHVLLLDNERTLEGDIERQGDQYRVKRAVGETLVPAQKVLRLCGSNAEAYAFLRSRANLGDPDEHLRLARWCQQHDLRSQAVQEAEAAVQLRPGHTPSQRLLHNLRCIAAPPAPPAVTTKPKPESAATPSVDVDLEVLGQFAVKVQPILMNTCANCHATGKGGDFKLTRAYGLSLGNRRATQQNLAAVLSQFNRQQWQVSPFLTKAVSVHGEAGRAPLPNRHAPAFRALEDWTKMAVAKLPNAQAAPEGSAGFAAGDEPPAKTAAPVVVAEPKNLPKPKENEEAQATPAPAPAAEPADPFDPEIFNRQIRTPKAGK